MHRDAMEFAERPVHTAKDTAAFLGREAKTVARMVGRGELEGVKMGNRWYISTESVMRKLGYIR